MHIALNARHMMKDRLEGIGTVTHEIMNRIVRQHPGDRFEYYFDRKFDPAFIHSPAVRGHAFFPPARLPFLIRYWMDYPVRKHIHQSGAEVLFSPDGFVPLNLRIPKVTMVHDIGFLRNPFHVTPWIRAFYEKWMPRYLEQTDHIITVSDFSKSELVAGYHLPPEKISVVYNGVSNHFHPLTEKEKQEVRDQVLDGKPFFLYLGAIHPRKNILTLIRAFEQYKSEYHSPHQLMIAGRPSWYTKEIYKAEEASKWKDEIHLPGFVETEMAVKLMASATALIYPSRYEGFGLPVIEAMASGTPVICSEIASLPEVAGEAALFFDPGNVEELASHLHLITTDDAYRYALVQRGFERIKMFSWDNAADAVYDVLKRYQRN